MNPWSFFFIGYVFSQPLFVNICFMWVHYSSVNKNAMYKKMKVFKRYLDAGLFPENYYNKIIH